MAMQVDDSSGPFHGFGTLRRSLRQINPFKSRIFRLPATPRLSRKGRALGKGEELTGWNFERPHQPISNSNRATPAIETLHASTPSSSTTPDISQHLDGMADDVSSVHFRFAHDSISQGGGSCRVNGRHARPPIPSYNPPCANEAENIIHEHMKNLLSSPASNRRYLFLPNTSYDKQGEVSDACWQTDPRRKEDLASPTQSTISLINNRTTFRSFSTGSSARQERPSLRPPYQLNGLFNQPSLKSLSPVGTIENGYTNFMPPETITTRLFTLAEVTAEGDAEQAFLGREWLFKELYQMVIVEHTRFSLINGGHGSGKTAIIRQLILQSPFYAQKSSNGDTVDSGIVVGSQISLSSTLSSRNYEWLRAVASRIVAYHNCRLYSATSCSIPEFVRNLASHMASSPLLKSYAEAIKSDRDLIELMKSEAMSLNLDPAELFKKLIIEPIQKVTMAEDECVIVVVDALDEADFHRNEGGESIAWLLKKSGEELPTWFRWVLSSTTMPPLCGLNVRTIHIDDAELDERVSRDSRLLIDYRITISPQLEQRIRERRTHGHMGDPITEFVEEMMSRSSGNQLYLHLLLDMIEQDRIRLKSTSLSLLPVDLSQLYLLHFNLSFTSLAQFHAVSPILSIVLASLRPLNFSDLLRILNSAHTEHTISEIDLAHRLSKLSPLLMKLSTGAYVPLHQSFREWLLKAAVQNQTDYPVDVRQGHVLHALALVRQGNLSSEHLFELGHHLLKANPHKYMRANIAQDMPTGRDCQLLWIQQAAGSSLDNALLYDRNLCYPNSKVSRLLLLAGVNSNAVWPNGDSLLNSYARTGNITMIHLLLQFGAEINYANPLTGETALTLAAKHGQLEAAKILHQFGALLTVCDRENRCALVHAAMSDSVPLVNFLLECDWNCRGETSVRSQAIRQAFETAASLGKVRICEYLLDSTDAVLDTSSAMCIACSHGHTQMVQFLLSRGATLSATQYWQGKSALVCAIESGSWDLVVNVLSTSHIDLNTDRTSNEGLSPLMVAARHGHVGLVDLLINRGSELDARDINGRTAVMHAIICKHASTAALLIDRGCDYKIADAHGNTLIHLLARYTNKCLIDRLLESGLSLEDKNKEDLRPVEVAIFYKSQMAIDLFLRRGARLRSLTWRIAVDSDPELVLVLVRKLLDDAAILFRRKRPTEALHRFHYALEKCTELLQEDASSSQLLANVDRNKLMSLRPKIRQYKLQILFAVACYKRNNNEFVEAIDLSTDALQLADNEENRFELHLFRAKCYFDGQNVSRARTDAELAASLRPENTDVQNLLSVLSMPPQ